MRKKVIALTVSTLVMAGVLGIWFGLLNNASAASDKGADPTLVVALRGEVEGFMMDIPLTPGGETEGNCFTLDMVDVKTGKVIGDATDCLADIDSGDNGGLILTGTTFFNFPGGQLVSRGRTTVQLLNEMAPGSPITHITGAIPAPGTNQVLSGTGRFKNASGTVRLSGAVDLSGLEEKNRIGFDCIFEINLKDK